MAFIDKYQHQIQQNVPVVYEGLEFHPLLVRDYPLYATARPAFELMLSSLANPRMARLPWCACLWALDTECEKQTGKLGEFLAEVLWVLSVALRLNANPETQSFPMRPVFTQSNELTAIMVGNPQGDYVLLNMQQMDNVRQIIAAQNGYDLPNEEWNPELVRAAQDNARRGDFALDLKFDDLVYSVALHAHCRASEVYEWTIREFTGIQDAIDRTLGYMIYTLVEKSGQVEFKYGNPYPTWKLNRKPNLPTGFRSVADIDAGAKGLIAGT